MNFRNFSIGNQLFIGFSAIVVAVLMLGLVSNNQAIVLHEQTEKLYNHPLVVRRAISEVEIGIYKMRLATRDFMLATTDKEREKAKMDGLYAEQNIQLNFEVIYKSYLGSKEDIDNARTAFNVWNNARQQNFEYILNGDVEQAKQSFSNEGNVGVLRNDLMNKIKYISDFATVKANSFYKESKVNADILSIELLIIVLLIVVVIIIVSFYFVKKIRTPLKELEHVIKAYRAGDFDVRSVNISGNEIGRLAMAFNELLDSVKTEKSISQKITHIADSMLIEDNAHVFFRSILPVLAAETNSQIAAVYLLNDQRTEFKLYESIGLDAKVVNNTFSATNFQGEFGPALITKKIQFIRSIPLETHFTFKAVSGNMTPREIVTIPIVVSNEVVAMVSLASLRKNSVENINLIHKIYDVLSARVESVLAYRNLQKSAKQLQSKNIELEQQRNELNQQAIELAQQNGELEIQKNQLKEASRLKTSFLSNMSHELRTPLNSVIALSGVLNRRLLNQIPEDEYSYIGVIERNGRQLLTLINDILDISRIEAGREEIEINEFEAQETVSDVVELIQQQAKDRGVALLFQNTDQRIRIQSDSKKVRHILQNLIANAVKFTEIGSVEIQISQLENKVYFQIKDSGIGISSENMKHIFDEFRQADSSTSRRFGGTGLGLAIAQKYARLLGGDIEVLSELNVGSQFTLVLPEKFDSNASIQPIETTIVNYSKPAMLFHQQHSILKNECQKSILLVEDSEPAIIQIKDMLESNSFSVVVARSGFEALQQLSTFTPDAMILDLMMPKMDGFELLVKIRNFEKTNHVPVLVLTAKHITKDDMQLLKSNHVHQLIQKGDVQREALLQAVCSMVVETETKTKTEVLVNKEEVNCNSSVNAKSVETLGAKLSVLIVEDNIDNMITVKAVIGEKYVIHEAVNGLKGVEMANEIVPDFILMDIALPELDGIQAFKQIRSNPRLVHIPVIALTASAMLSERETILAYGFDAYIPKPIDDKQFFEIINTVLHGK